MEAGIITILPFVISLSLALIMIILRSCGKPIIIVSGKYEKSSVLCIISFMIWFPMLYCAIAFFGFIYLHANDIQAFNLSLYALISLIPIPIFFLVALFHSFDILHSQHVGHELECQSELRRAIEEYKKNTPTKVDFDAKALSAIQNEAKENKYIPIHEMPEFDRLGFPYRFLKYEYNALRKLTAKKSARYNEKARIAAEKKAKQDELKKQQQLEQILQSTLKAFAEFAQSGASRGYYAHILQDNVSERNDHENQKDFVRIKDFMTTHLTEKGFKNIEVNLETTNCEVMTEEDRSYSTPTKIGTVTDRNGNSADVWGSTEHYIPATFETRYTVKIEFRAEW